MLFKDALFEAQWLRAVGHCGSGGADVGECLAVANKIKEPDAESWFEAWNSMAQRILVEAEESTSGGHDVSAMCSYLRASNYFRAAYTFFIEKPIDQRLVNAYNDQKSAFEKAASMMCPKAKVIHIPYEGVTLRGYVFKADDTDTPKQTLIVNGGYDSTAEECYFFSGAAAVARGYTCIVFDGPGQGNALIEKGLVFRDDWENVIRPVVDYVVTLPEVDADRIALMGVSFGGYLAPRAASGEPRISACIADPGEFSLSDEFKSRLPWFVAQQLPDGNRVVLYALRLMLNNMMRHVTKGWALRRGMFVHGVDDALDYVVLTERYSLEGRTKDISCPTLVCRAENDKIGATARKLYDALTCDKKFIDFAASEGAGEHCESGARFLFNQRAFDWLDEVNKKLMKSRVNAL